LDPTVASWRDLMTADAIAQAAVDDCLGRAVLDLWRRMELARPTTLDGPGVADVDLTPLASVLGRTLLRNVGDPFHDGGAVCDTKPMERQVVGFLADLLRAPPRRRWGYVTTSGDEATLVCLRHARAGHRNAVVYHSETARECVTRAADVLAMDSVVVRADRRGEVDYDDLAAQLARHRHRPAVVVASIGAGMGEAVDDVRRIGRVLDTQAVRRRHIHADAPLAGVPLALLDPPARAGLDFADGAGSVVVGGHTFVGCPIPCEVLVVKTARRRAATITGAAGATTAAPGSRCGHAPLLLWYTLARHRLDGLRRRAERCRQTAGYAHAQLAGIGWPAYCGHPHSFTVAMRTPPPSVVDRWTLANEGGWSRVVCLPGVTHERIDAFVRDVETSREDERAPAGPRMDPAGAHTAGRRPESH
jgi:histidine decarboxylase